MILDPCFNSDRWKLHFVQGGCVDQLLEIEDSNLMRKVMDIIILVVSEGKANSLYKLPSRVCNLFDTIIIETSIKNNYTKLKRK